MDLNKQPTEMQLKQFTYYQEHKSVPHWLVMTYGNVNYVFRMVENDQGQGDKACHAKLIVDETQLSSEAIENPIHKLILENNYGENKQTVLIAQDVVPASPSAQADRHSVGEFLKNMKPHLSGQPIYLHQEWPAPQSAPVPLS